MTQTDTVTEAVMELKGKKRIERENYLVFRGEGLESLRGVNGSETNAK